MVVLYDKILIKEENMIKQSSRNWCRLAVAETVSKYYDADSNWTQDRIFLECAKNKPDKYGDPDKLKEKMYEEDAKLKSYADLTKTGNSLETGLDKRGSFLDALGVTGNLGIEIKVPGGFPHKEMTLFEFIKDEVHQGRLVAAVMKYNAFCGEAAGIRHAMLIVGARADMDIKDDWELDKVYWANPDPQKPELGMVRGPTPLYEFKKLQNKADLVSVWQTRKSLTKAPST